MPQSLKFKVEFSISANRYPLPPLHGNGRDRWPLGAPVEPPAEPPGRTGAAVAGDEPPPGPAGQRRGHLPHAQHSAK